MCHVVIKDNSVFLLSPPSFIIIIINIAHVSLFLWVLFSVYCNPLMAKEQEAKNESSEEDTDERSQQSEAEDSDSDDFDGGGGGGGASNRGGRQSNRLSSKRGGEVILDQDPNIDREEVVPIARPRP